eukprot:g25102.t1
MRDVRWEGSTLTKWCLWPLRLSKASRVNRGDPSTRPLFLREAATGGQDAPPRRRGGRRSQGSLIDIAARQQKKHTQPAQAATFSEGYIGLQAGGAAMPSSEGKKGGGKSGGKGGKAGQKSSEQPSQDSLKPRFCPFCGGEAKPDFRFCQFCGASLNFGQVAQWDRALQADPRACSLVNAFGEQPLHIAARVGQDGIVRRLLRCGAEKHMPTQDQFRATPLHLAAAHGHHKVVEVLLDAKADPTVVDSRGLVPARWAERRGHPQLAELLDDARHQAGDFDLADPKGT